MDIEIDDQDIEKTIKNLYSYAYMTNSNLDDDIILDDDPKDIENSSSSDLQSNFKELIISLLKFKKLNKQSEKAELVQRSDQFETLFQKLENEVRNHYRLENQLKLHFESFQEKIEELEKTESFDLNTIKELEEKCDEKKNPKSSEVDKVRKEMDERLRNSLENAEKKDKALHKIEYENVKLKALLEEKTREYEGIKKELVKIKKITPRKKVVQGMYKIDVVQVDFEASKSRNSLDSSGSLRGYGNRNKKRCSFGESDFERLAFSPIKKDSSATLKNDDSNFLKAPAWRNARKSVDQVVITSGRKSIKKGCK
ncbi:hypothetical protein SteCoe_9920 [Stentor coeruleus]|uniref:Uncharacterized protein n=1 Tax=Stentor coeruleus TaxID=5963 RepID=A0A1R2CGQ3_9CILI|nr:hypothetical protein SteCoe_9920 [Stentor coeruleus]